MRTAVVDDAREPVAAVILTEWGRVWGCDPMTIGSTPAVSPAAIWARALELVDSLRLVAVETLVRDDDVEWQRLVAGSGFAMVGDTSGTCWMDAEERPAVAPFPSGLTLSDRTRQGWLPHPLRTRNGSAVQARLRQCSLYDPSLDLAIRAEHGEVAGYALFWFDPVTRVGLVEPMRVEDAYQRRGLARAMPTEGLARLVRRGARRLKVGYGTDIARALYVGAGFQVTSSCRTYRTERRCGDH